MRKIDELNRLHEAATKGPRIEGPVFWLLRYASKHDIDIYMHKDGTPLTDEETFKTPGREDASAIVALHNAWPAIHRVLVAARETKERLCQMHDAPGRMPTINIHRTMLLQAFIEPIEQALQAMDGVENPAQAIDS